jgi:hypothetical protein
MDPSILSPGERLLPDCSGWKLGPSRLGSALVRVRGGCEFVRPHDYRLRTSTAVAPIRGALAVAKERAKGHVTKASGRALILAPVIEELKAFGAVSHWQIAAGLNAKGIRTARRSAWCAMQDQ